MKTLNVQIQKANNPSKINTKKTTRYNILILLKISGNKAVFKVARKKIYIYRSYMQKCILTTSKEKAI